MAEPRQTSPILPAQDLDSEAFWAGCREGRLSLPSCETCGSVAFPPRRWCGRCACVTRGVWNAEAPTGRVVSFTVTPGGFRPGLADAYTLAIVQLDDAPEVRLTLRVVGAGERSAVAIGINDRVVVAFEHHEEWSVPVAQPLCGGDPDQSVPSGLVPPVRGAPGRNVPMVNVAGPRPEDQVVIAGVGRSEVGRRLFRSDLDLTLDAARRAVADAGITLADIDGVATYPGAGVGPPGYSGPHTHDVLGALGISPRWHRAGAEGAGQLQPLFDAVLAVAAGLCRHALVYRTSTESTAAALMKEGRIGPPAMGPAAGFAQWLVPFDAVTPAHWLAPYQQRHMFEFGTTRAQVGVVSVVAREHAAVHPHGILTTSLTLDDHADARMISSPIGLLDCDIPVDGAIAIVVSRTDVADTLRPGAAVAIEAMGAAVGHPPSWHQWPDLTTMAAHGAASSMWSRTTIQPADVDVAQLYDGFAFLALYWLEALGFCGLGEAGAFVGDGQALRVGGALPLNTAGGQLSGGRLHGWGLLEEAIHQVRGTAIGVQVPRADVAVASTGGGPIAGCVLLRRR